jgi:hypothetical protein
VGGGDGCGCGVCVCHHGCVFQLSQNQCQQQNKQKISCSSVKMLICDT